MATRLELVFDNGTAGQKLIEKMTKKFGPAVLSGTDDAAWDNPSRELVDFVVTQVMEDDLVLQMAILKD